MDNNENKTTFINDESAPVPEEPKDASPAAEESPAPDAAEPENEKKEPSFASEFFDFFEMFIISAIIVTVLFSFCMRLCSVQGESMESTLFENEILIVSDLFYKPECGDIIVFHHTSETYPGLNEPIVKRVIATEGEYVDIEIGDQRLIITVYDENMENPRVLDDEHAQYVDYFVTSSVHEYPVRVPEGCIFAMGDNRNHSTDSRSSLIGFIDQRSILGKVICRLTPFSKFGPVD